MKCWVTAVAPLGQHAEKAVKHEPCLPDPAGQDSDVPVLSGLHVGPALCQNPQGAFPQTFQLSWMQEAPAYAAAAVSRKSTKSLLCPDGLVTALNKTHKPWGYLAVIKMVWMEGKV